MNDIREPKRLNIRISAELHDWLVIESKTTGISKTSIIAFAVEEYKTRKEKK